MGGLAGSLAWGSLSFTVDGENAFLDSGPTGTVDATGTWSQDGAAVNLVGTYDGGTKLVTLLGSRGSSYSFVNDPVSPPAERITGGVSTGSSPSAWVAYKMDSGRTFKVLCGAGTGASLGHMTLVLVSDGTASVAMQFQTIPWTPIVTRSGDSLSWTTAGYTFTGTITGSGDNASGTVTNGMDSGTWAVGVTGC